MNRRRFISKSLIGAGMIGFGGAYWWLNSGKGSESLSLSATHAFLKDLQSNLVIGTYDFEKITKTYRLNNDVSLANLVANHVYQMATPNFAGIQKNIKEITPITSIEKIAVKDFKNVLQLNSLIKMIQEKGVKYSLKAELESINQSEAMMLLYFDGKLDEIKGLITSMQAAKKDINYEVIEESTRFSIKFNSEPKTL